MAAPDSTPTIQAVRTLWSALPEQQVEKLAVAARLRPLIDRAEPFFNEEQRAEMGRLRPLLDVGPVGLDDLPEGVL